MKIFILAVAVMVATGALIGWSGWYVGRVCGDLLSILERFPQEMGQLDAFEKEYLAFERRWFGSERWISMIVGDAAAAEVEKQFVAVGFRYLDGESGVYREGVGQLRLLLEDMRDGGKVKIEKIL